jgi:hypothetical protein
LIQLIRWLAFAQAILPLVFVGATVSPFVLAFVAFVTFLAVMAGGNPADNTPASSSLTLITVLTYIGVVAAAAATILPGFGILFAIAYIGCSYTWQI